MTIVKWLKYAVRTLLLGVTVLLSTMVLLTALLKIGALNYFAKTQIETLFAENLNGRIEIGKIDIDFFKGVAVSDIKVFVQGETNPALSADSLSVVLDYAQLLNQETSRKLHFKRISLSRPIVRLTEVDSGVFNFEKLFKSSQDTVKKTSDQRPLQLVFDRVELRGGDLRVQKRPGSTTRDPELIAMLKERNIVPVNYDSLHIQDLNLLAKANVEPRYLSGVLQEFNFAIPEADFKLIKSVGYFFFTERRSEILAFEAETNLSKLSLSVSLSQFNIFKPIKVKELEKSSVFLRLKTEKFLVDDLSKFIPEAAVVAGEYKINLKAKGDLQEVMLERCNIQTDSSQVKLTGTLLNVLTPSRLWMDIDIEKSFINLPELSHHISTIDLKDYEHLGTVEISGKYHGHLNDFSAETDLVTIAGSGHADLKLDFSKGKPIKYAGKILLKKLDLATLMKDPGLKSNLNISGEIDGQGLTLETVKGKFVGRVDSSKIAERTISTSQLDLQMNQKRLVGNFSIVSGKQKAHFDGEVDFAQEIYSGQGFLESVDLSKVLRDDSLSTDLTLSYYVRGKGFALKNMNTNFSMTFDSSTVREFVISSGTTVSLSVEQTDSIATVELLSDIVDFHGKGNFDLARLRLLGEREYAAFVHEVLENNIFKKEGSTQVKIGSIILPAPSRSAIAAADSALPVLDLSYDIQLKDLTQFFSLVKVGYVNVIGAVEGNLKSTPQAMSVTANVKIDQARYNDLLGVLDFKTALTYKDTLAFSQSGHRNKPYMTLALDAGRVKYLSNKFSQTNLVYTYKDREVYLNFRTTNDNAEALVDLDATGRLADGQYVIDLRNLTFATQDYLWQLGQNAKV
ncbi:MAG: hypothetical protein HGB11_04340, partial [Chlorobiales bacterium]|nr:hypothetical protein [Chlorobiales bacterium]